MAKLRLQTSRFCGKLGRAVFNRPEIEGNISPNDRKGFTLIELLVSIAIIGILAAIILPGVFYGLRAAKTSACAANLSQLGIATLSYARDNDGQFPPYTFNVYSPSSLVSYSEADAQTDAFKRVVSAYGLAGSQWFCPLDPWAHRDPIRKLFKGNHDKTSYVGDFPIRDWPGMHRPAASEAMLPDPSRYQMYEDDDLAEEPANGCYAVKNPQENLMVCETPHGYRANAVFFDGHVKMTQAGDWEKDEFNWPN